MRYARLNQMGKLKLARQKAESSRKRYLDNLCQTAQHWFYSLPGEEQNNIHAKVIHINELDGKQRQHKRKKFNQTLPEGVSFGSLLSFIGNKRRES